MRQSVEPGTGVAISSFAYEYPTGCLVPAHAHRSDQLIYATRGVMEVMVKRRCWLIPPQFALWIPARTRHRLRMPAAVSMRTLYLRPGVTKKMPDDCAVLHVSVLLRELIVEIVRLQRLKTRTPLHAALRAVLVASLQSAHRVPACLVLPQDRRAAAVARATMDDFTSSRSFQELCRSGGASIRTIERIFLREVGSSFEIWRRQARLMKAIELLAAGRNVKETAAEVGYRQPSAFVSVFRATFGQTPTKWLASVADKAGDEKD